MAWLHIQNLFTWRTYWHRCPDGDKKLYRSVDYAFPIFIKGFKANISAELSPITQVPAGARGEYESKVDGMLVALDDRNNSLMFQFRTVYLLYQSDPCKHSEDFRSTILEINKKLDDISTLKIKLGGFIEVVKASPEPTPELLRAYVDLANQLGGATIAEVAQAEIEESRDLVRDLLKGGQD